MRTGVDKDDWFDEKYTKFQVVTYGMMWHWLVKGGMQAQERLYRENCCFLLDEFSGQAPGGDPNKLQADWQMTEVARLLARFVRENSETHRLMVAGAALDVNFLKTLFPDASYLAFNERMFPLRRVIVAPRKMDEILSLCAQLIIITLQKDFGNILVFLPGMDEILKLEKLVQKKQGRHAPELLVVRLHSDCLG